MGLYGAHYKEKEKNYKRIEMKFYRRWWFQHWHII